MNEFKKGDLVECVNNKPEPNNGTYYDYSRNELTIGKRYKVIRVERGRFIHFIDDKGEENNANIIRFKPALFRVGDEIRCISLEGEYNANKNWLTVGKVYKITHEEKTSTSRYKSGQNGHVIADDRSNLSFHYGTWELVLEDKMNKYTDIENRIKMINQRTSLEEMDDILWEIREHQKISYWITIGNERNDYVYISDYTKRYHFTTFRYRSQCEKLDAIKKAYMWLLDNSNIKKNEKKEKIAELRKEIELFNKGMLNKIKELENE